MKFDNGVRELGPWRLTKKLGEGGNATVWQATSESHPEPVALKLLNSKKVGREPYKRFVREIDTLKQLGNQEGVLPLLEFRLPEKPTTKDPPWLAMPIATLITDALEGEPLELVVEALASITETLSQLRDTYGIAHRDLKPANLYRFRTKWLVGDFGLVSVPDLEELTQSSRPLGPAHYTAYEMIQDPVAAEPHPADVYSIGKTLWVLATGQRFPPEGHQPASTRKFSIADLRPHPRAAELDRLIDLCTRLHPEERPTMKQVAEDLRGWLHLNLLEPISLDLTDVGTRIRSKLNQELAQEDIRAQRLELAHGSVRRLQKLIQPLNESLRGAHPRAEIDVMDDHLVQKTLRSSGYIGTPEIIFRWQRSSRISSGRPGIQYMLRIGRSIELTDDGNLLIHAMVDVGRDGLAGSDYNWMADETAPVGSIESDRLLEDVVARIASRLPEALEVFAEHLPEAAS